MIWRLGPCLCLIVFLSLTKPSKENCKEYFTQKQWKTTATTTAAEENTELKMVSLVITQNISNVAECTLKKYCLQEEMMCHVFNDCFPIDAHSQSEKCEPVRNLTVHTHHLMCLLARVVISPKTVNGCEYASVCPLFEERWQEATALPTATIPKTIMTSTVWPSQTAPPPTSKVAGNGHHAENMAIQCKDNFSLTVLLVISSTLAIVLPFAVYFYMRCQMKQDKRGQYDKPHSNCDLLLDNITVPAS